MQGQDEILAEMIKLYMAKFIYMSQGLERLKKHMYDNRQNRNRQTSILEPDLKIYLLLNFPYGNDTPKCQSLFK